MQLARFLSKGELEKNMLQRTHLPNSLNKTGLEIQPDWGKLDCSGTPLAIAHRRRVADGSPDNEVGKRGVDYSAADDKVPSSTP